MKAQTRKNRRERLAKQRAHDAIARLRQNLFSWNKYKAVVFDTFCRLRQTPFSETQGWSIGREKSQGRHKKRLPFPRLTAPGSSRMGKLSPFVSVVRIWLRYFNRVANTERNTASYKNFFLHCIALAYRFGSRGKTLTKAAACSAKQLSLLHRETFCYRTGVEKQWEFLSSDANWSKKQKSWYNGNRIGSPVTSVYASLLCYFQLRNYICEPGNEKWLSFASRFSLRL